MKLAAGAFLAGANSRLLPASIPFGYFGVAVACHVFAWLVLLIDAHNVPRFVGGLGPTLAALHLITLGVLAMTAIGASLQLLPVATRRPIGSPRTLAVLFWLYAPGVLVLCAGMALGHAGSLLAAGTVVGVVLVAYALLLWRNLGGDSAMPAVTSHGRAAIVALAIALGSATALAVAYVGIVAAPRAAALALHVAFASYGFMGLLALGFSYILIPMFALSQPPDAKRARASLGFAIAALAAYALAALGVVPGALAIVAIAVAAVAVGIHVRLMRTALATGMRRELGRSMQLVRLSWAFLAASLVAALVVRLDLAADVAAMLFGVLLLPGWLLTLLLGMLQRIVPFLASMHAARGQPRPPTPSALTSQRALDVHFVCHLAALGLLAAAVLLDSVVLARTAAMVGLSGAVAFAVFFAIVVRRMTQGAHAGRSIAG